MAMPLNVNEIKNPYADNLKADALFAEAFKKPNEFLDKEKKYICN